MPEQYTQSADEFLAGLKAEFEPAQNTTSQPPKRPSIVLHKI